MLSGSRKVNSLRGDYNGCYMVKTWEAGPMAGWLQETWAWSPWHQAKRGIKPQYKRTGQKTPNQNRIWRSSNPTKALSWWWSCCMCPLKIFKNRGISPSNPLDKNLNTQRWRWSICTNSGRTERVLSGTARRRGFSWGFEGEELFTLEGALNFFVCVHTDKIT